MGAEAQRIEENNPKPHIWHKWGPYLAERAWGSVREDYSADGNAWDYFPHDHARSRVYRWNEDGLLGWSDNKGLLCFALALWNGRDPIIKERAFGLTNAQGNHGEDVKELYYYLDNTPTHSYARALYKYPQAAFPYEELIEENRRRTKDDPEFELFDTGVFNDNRYFDVTIEYAKANADDTLIRITVENLGPDAAMLDVLPTLWFRNTWSWSEDALRPMLGAETIGGTSAVLATHPQIGPYRLWCDEGVELLFTENETNAQKLFNAPNQAAFVKDGINDYLVHDQKNAVNPAQKGTKVSARYCLTLEAGQKHVIRLRLAPAQDSTPGAATWDDDFDDLFSTRQSEADEFFAPLCQPATSDDMRMVQRQALAGLLWSKQFFHYNVKRWLDGDPTQPPPPDSRRDGRNHNWAHLDCANVMLMPDTWEYPWFAAWDWAFHCLTMAMIDPDFAKRQMLLPLRVWMQHPNGQIPAYEWAFGDVNPPVHAWAALRIFRMERKRTGQADWTFLQRVFHKLLLNFTWWVNRKDSEGRNVFQGGFLGLDNIGVFDRSAPLPGNGRLDQADGTAWMATYCLNMLSLALELARNDPAYEDVATKFLEHFFYIAHAINNRAATRGEDADEGDLWDDEDNFYYDVLHLPGQEPKFLKVRSLVGLIPILAVETLDADLLEKLPAFAERLDWFLEHRCDLTSQAASVTRIGAAERRLFAIVDEEKLRHLLTYVLEDEEFLSPHGIRAVSRFHLANPYRIEVAGQSYEVSYQPAESKSGLFGGNSNWRGPIWFPINYLLIEALQKFDYYYGNDFRIECPTGSHQWKTLWEVSAELSGRLISTFTRDANGRRPVFGGNERYNTDPRFSEHIPFHEYFHGDNGAGIGASHQTGWTALVAKLIQQSGVTSAASSEG